MKNARITYFGSGLLHLQMRRFPAGKAVTCRLDEILPQERRRYRDALMVLGLDGQLINIGRMVPNEEAVKAIEANKNVDDSHTGFFVEAPLGFAVREKQKGATLEVVSASSIAAEEPVHVLVAPPEPEPMKEEAKPKKPRRRGRRPKKKAEDLWEG